MSSNFFKFKKSLVENSGTENKTVKIQDKITSRQESYALQTRQDFNQTLKVKN